MVANDPTQDRHIAEISPLVPPEHLRHELALAEAQRDLVLSTRAAVSAILDGEDDRLLVIVGPCSVHDPHAALDYAERLAAVSTRSANRLCIVMRVYFEKPRTTLGWKGLINDPGLDGSHRINDGLFLARSLLLKILSLGLPVACEFLDPIIPQYIADAVSWGAIGARTTHSQIHRQLASGLSMPVGFKNPPGGEIQAAVDAVTVARQPQVFAGITEDGRAAIFSTSGNPDCHVVLRGSTAGPNFDEASVSEVLDRLDRTGLPRRVLVDASHDNSRKDHERQPVVAADIAQRISAGSHDIVGIMLESFLAAGHQELRPGHASDLVYGQSITDACMSWEMTVDVLNELSEAVATRRALVRS